MIYAPSWVYRVIVVSTFHTFAVLPPLLNQNQSIETEQICIVTLTNKEVSFSMTLTDSVIFTSWPARKMHPMHNKIGPIRRTYTFVFKKKMGH